MTAREARELPETIALLRNKDGEFTLVAGDKAPKGGRIPTKDPLVILRFIVDLQKGGHVVNMYAVFCPKYGDDGNVEHVYGKDGKLVLTRSGRPSIQTIPTSQGLKEVEDGQRTVTLTHGKWGTFKLNVLRHKAERKAPKAADEYFDIAAYFSDKTKPKK